MEDSWAKLSGLEARMKRGLWAAVGWKAVCIACYMTKVRYCHYVLLCRLSELLYNRIYLEYMQMSLLRREHAPPGGENDIDDR